MVAQQKVVKQKEAKRGWLDFEHTTKLKNDEILKKDK